jgi:hypothetical protein
VILAAQQSADDAANVPRHPRPMAAAPIRFSKRAKLPL